MYCSKCARCYGPREHRLTSSRMTSLNTHVCTTTAYYADLKARPSHHLHNIRSGLGGTMTGPRNTAPAETSAC